MTLRSPSKGTSIYDCPVINGWHLFFHPLFLDQLENVTKSVEQEKAKKPKTYQSSANAKTLASIRKLIFKQIPDDPTSKIYRQGKTLGDDMKHWFRAKFGGQRFRLFFRYSTSSNVKIIIYVWVNDSNTLRTYGSKSDAYAVFKKMLSSGNPPDDWNQLFAACNTAAVKKRADTAAAAHQRDNSD